MSLSAYVRNLIFNDIQNRAHPICKMLQSSLNDLEIALKEAKTGNLKSASNVDELLAD